MFRWFFKKRATAPPPSTMEEDHDDSEVEPQHISYEEGRILAQQEAIRELHESPELITYITYSECFDDYCRVEIRFESPDRGTYSIGSLPMAERLDAELIDDAKIAAVAKAGRRLNAVRLHCVKYDNNSADAVAAIKAIESKS